MLHTIAFAFSSSLPIEHRDEAERILFFNLQQEKMAEGIRVVSKAYGLPKLVATHDRLHMTVSKGIAVQTLFVTARGHGGDRLVGAIVFTREVDALVAIYMAVHEDYSASGPCAGEKLMIKMLKELESIARRVRGVETLHLYLGGDEPVRKKIRR